MFRVTLLDEIFSCIINCYWSNPDVNPGVSNCEAVLAFTNLGGSGRSLRKSRRHHRAGRTSDCSCRWPHGVESSGALPEVMPESVLGSLKGAENSECSALPKRKKQTKRNL